MKITSIFATILLSFLSLRIYAQSPTIEQVFDIPPITILNDTKPTHGYIFQATINFDSHTPNHLIILDEHGNVVFDRERPLGNNANVDDFKPQPGGRYSFYDFSGNIYYILDKNFHIIDGVRAVGFQTDNHELLIDEKNHYYLMGTEQRSINMANIVSGGSSVANVVGIVVQELDSLKNVIFEWKTLDHLPITDCKGQDLTSNYIDYIHTNSLCVDTDSTILLSNRHLNEITKVNRKTGEIVWRMGLHSNGNEFTFINDTLGFSYQHCVRRLPNGNITLFDNGNYRGNTGERFTRVCEYKIDEVNRTATLVWQYRNSPDVVSSFMGSVQRLPNGNTFIGWGGSTPSATEVDSLGNKVFECSFPPSSQMYSYRAFKFDIPNIDSLRNTDNSAIHALSDSILVASHESEDILKEILGDSTFAHSNNIYFVTDINSNSATIAYKNENDFISYKAITLLENAATSVRLDDTPKTAEARHITVYPNPSTGDFRMSVNSAEAVPVSIYNALGQLVMQKTVIEGETFNNFPTGVYAMIVSLRNQNLYCKFVVTH